MQDAKRLWTAGLVALAAAGLQGQAPQTPALPKGWVLHTAREGKIYWVSGAVSNSTIIIGDTGVIIVDPKAGAPAGADLVKLAGELSPKPVTHLIETHSDTDHVTGVAGFPAGIKIVAHENNLLEQEQILRLATVESEGGHGLPIPDRMPNLIIRKDKVDTHIDGVHVVFYHFGPAHTNGDLVTYLPDYKVAVVGDILESTAAANGMPPQSQGQVWKFEKYGSIEGWFKNVDGLLALDADTYISGHDDTVFDKASIRKLRADLKADVDKVDAMAEGGKSLAEIQTAFGDQNYPPHGVRGPTGPDIRGIQYMSLAWIEYHEWLLRKEELK